VITKRAWTSIAAGVIAATIGIAQVAMGANQFIQTNLVSNGAVPFTITDPNLVNAWGIAFFPGEPFWINDNGTGLSTLYDGAGNIIPLVVKIPLPPGSTASNAAPTGMVVNTTTQLFVIPGTTQIADFIFATEDGTISGWNPLVDLNNAKLIIDNSASGAVYKGLAMGNNTTGEFLYATNFNSGKIDVFNSSFNPATLSGSFTDPNLPAGYAPFGIANIRGYLFVTYALQDAAKHNDVAGKGHGFVDIFDTNGNLFRRFVSRGMLNSPWGVAEAPYGFGSFDADILIGNFGDGKISAYGSKTGDGHGFLRGTSNKVISIDGLWALTFGGALGSNPNTLYFTAGPNSEADGLFGSLSPQ
jgi:uncharacterized protein (TIGR03118 family)